MLIKPRPRFLLAGALALGLVPVAARAQTAPSNPASSGSATAVVAGRVLDAAGHPVAGATVTLDSSPYHLIGEPAPPGASTRSAADGGFRLAVSPAEVYRLQIEAAGFLAHAATLVAPAHVETRLSRGQRLTGRVTGPDGRAVAGAQVGLAFAGEEWHLGPWATNESRGVSLPPSVATDAAGRYALAGVPAGRLALMIAAPGLAPWRGPVITVPAGEREIDAGEARLAPEVEIRGRVLDGAFRPLAGARLQIVERYSGLDFAATSLLPNRAETGTDGGFRFGGLAEGERVGIWVQADGFASATIRTSAVTPSFLDLRLAPLARLRGRVLGLAGEAVAGAEIRPGTGLLPPNRKIYSGSDGTFGPIELPAGHLELSAKAAGLYSAEIPLDLQAGAEREVEVRLLAGASVAGAARDADGRPLDRARVSVATGLTPDRRYHDGFVYTDSAGEFRFDALPPGRYGFEVLPFDGPALEQEAEITVGANRLDLVLPTETASRRSLAGRVVDAAGRPVPGALVGADGEDVHFARRTWSGAEGRFAFAAVPVGHLAVWAYAPGLPRTRTSVEVAAAPTGEVIVRIPPGCRLSGRALGIAAGEASWVRVSAGQGPGIEGLITGLDAAGRFELGPLGPGTWDLAVWDTRGEHRSERKIVVGDESTLAVDLELAPATPPGSP